jgi:NAD(P)H-flavin reductase
VALENSLLPKVAVIEKITRETKDIKTFRVVAPAGGSPFNFLPGQCAMVSVPPVGEAIFSITSSPTEKEYLEFSIKKSGAVTQYLHETEESYHIGIRGPYGNGFPIKIYLRIGPRLPLPKCTLPSM